MEIGEQGMWGKFLAGVVGPGSGNWTGQPALAGHLKAVEVGSGRGNWQHCGTNVVTQGKVGGV